MWGKKELGGGVTFESVLFLSWAVLLLGAYFCICRGRISGCILSTRNSPNSVSHVEASPMVGADALRCLQSGYMEE